MVEHNLLNGPQCKIDAQLIADLGANVVRVYSVDPTLSSEECMNAFADKGIYLIIDMATPRLSISRVRFRVIRPSDLFFGAASCVG